MQPDDQQPPSAEAAPAGHFDGAAQPAPSAGTLAWVVPGPLGQPTGGYLYDARMVHALAALGWEVGVLNVGSRAWPLDLLGAGRLVHGLEGRSWDVVVFDELAHPTMAPGLPWLRIAQTCPDAILVGLVHHLRASEPAPPIRRLVARTVERIALGGLDIVICTSRHTAGTLRDVLGRLTSVHVVQPGFDTQALDAGEAPPGPARSSERGTLRALAVAHWTPRKDLLTALRAVALAPPGVTLDLVGDVSRDSAYARRVSAALRHPALAGRVRVHGTVESERLAELYAGADAFLLTSTHEGYGMVLAEALRAGLPIVATRVGAVPELLSDESGAELVEPRDAAGLARALQRLADDPDARARRSEQAVARGQALPSWHQSAAQFDRLLRDAVAARRGLVGAPGRSPSPHDGLPASTTVDPSSTVRPGYAADPSARP